MAPKFGTSGLRGLVAELTPALVADHMRAFIAACDVGSSLYVGRDLRPSSPEIAGEVIAAAKAEGVDVVDCGALPTPALALAARQADAGAIMVTGSHIPADRNGLKFYTRLGEITKSDEAAITAALGRQSARLAGGEGEDTGAAQRFVSRYISACGSDALSGRNVGLYAHSAVGRDTLRAVLEGLGAEVMEFARSETFIPVDTEAVDPKTRNAIRRWVSDNALDALVSTDGDSDRPLLADETGSIVPGDIMGQITAQALGAQCVVTPISSNSGVLQKDFERVETTRIGSPYVIAGMEALGGKVVGYEANGGFLLGFEAQGPNGPFAALPTRDCVLPIVMTLIAAGQGAVSERVAQEPPVFTVADRIQEISQERSQPFVEKLRESAQARAEFLNQFNAEETSVNLVDGVRMLLTDGRVLHVRPSGNAPELRLYVEAVEQSAAEALLAEGVAALKTELG
ncbi:MAG: phosphomannomutase [Dinoroseobacter sp.]|nr:phosphomannomutase [Dinoroseobacter sp.]